MISNLHAQRTAIDEQIARESRAEAITLWEAAKAQARAAKQHVGKMRRVFNESAAAWSAYEKECTLVLHALETHVANQPADDDFPTAEELRAWEEKRARLQQLLTVSMHAHRLELASVMEQNRCEVLQADQNYITLAYAERVARTKALER
jgi:hypothetical protein